MNDEAEWLLPKGKLPVRAAVNYLRRASVEEGCGLRTLTTAHSQGGSQEGGRSMLARQVGTLTDRYVVDWIWLDILRFGCSWAGLPLPCTCPSSVHLALD